MNLGFNFDARRGLFLTPSGRMRPTGPKRPDSGNGPENQDRNNSTTEKINKNQKKNPRENVIGVHPLLRIQLTLWRMCQSNNTPMTPEESRRQDPLKNGVNGDISQTVYFRGYVK